MRIAHTNIEAVQAVQKKRYDVKHRESSFIAVDDKVLTVAVKRGRAVSLKNDLMTLSS